ncbi:hypothetical protein P3X46_004590 [Hevea brasiliensis]|uniref:Uncharacterized protein n=1 Tax=Hevea brasiliensis TaxID=3981 RepID=A0ABQ9MZ46_HEVBR|nr:hypothetical protein P3X46_004590 [Hevea brasiliensis]
MGYIAAKHNIMFVIDLSTKNQPIFNSAKSGKKLDQQDPKGVFKFNADANYEISSTDEVLLEELKISWHVVLRGWNAVVAKSVFTMLDCEGKVRIGEDGDGSFSEELPSPGCCNSDSRRSGGKVMRMGKVSVSILSMVKWRYVSVDDALWYLQYFLLP